MVSGGKGELFLTAILGGIGALWLVQKPHWGVLIIQALMFIELDFLFGVTYLVGAVLAIPFAWAVLRERGTWLLQVPQIQLLLLIAFLFALSTLWSEFKYPVTLYPERDQTTKLTREFITHLGWLVFFLYFINTRERIELAVKLQVGLICAAAISALLLFVSSGAADRAEAAFSMAKNSNRLAYISIFATCVIWFYHVYGRSQRLRLLTMPLLIILPLAALASGSRGGLLQLATLALAIVKDQKGWSPTKRIYFMASIAFIGVLTLAVVPSSYLERAMNFDTAGDAAGQESLQNRTRVVVGALQMIATDPIFGAGFGNYPWVARAYLGVGGATHNSYLWAFTSGGVGVFASYLLLFCVTYRMLRRLERGQGELLWLVKATKVNLLLFLICSVSTDFWLSDFLYLIIGLTVSMVYLQRYPARSNANPARVRSTIMSDTARLAVTTGR
jgi:hypothetical protein